MEVGMSSKLRNQGGQSWNQWRSCRNTGVGLRMYWLLIVTDSPWRTSSRDETGLHLWCSKFTHHLWGRKQTQAWPMIFSESQRKSGATPTQSLGLVMPSPGLFLWPRGLSCQTVRDVFFISLHNHSTQAWIWYMPSTH